VSDHGAADEAPAAGESGRRHVDQDSVVSDAERAVEAGGAQELPGGVEHQVPQLMEAGISDGHGRSGDHALQQTSGALVGDPGHLVELDLAGGRAAVSRCRVAVVALLLLVLLNDSVPARLDPAHLGAAVAALDVPVVALLGSLENSVAAQGGGAGAGARVV